MSKSILIVDDSATMRQQLRGFLENNGFDVIEATDGTEGLELCRVNDIDLMIVDINMERMNGIEMITEVRKLPRHTDTPILVLTTESSSSTMTEARSVGASAWIVKPFKPDILLRGIKKMTS